MCLCVVGGPDLHVCARRGVANVQRIGQNDSDVVEFPELLSNPPQPLCPATVTLSVDNEAVAETRVDRQVPQRCGTETFDVGMDCVSPVCDDYADRGLFPFTGIIQSVTFDFGDHDELGDRSGT